MNILPKKSWHVRTKDNIARVRRDEAEALEKEKELERRAKLAEQEARINILRGKAKQASFLNVPPQSDIYTDKGNINFFKDAEMGHSSGKSIKEEEEKKEKEEYEKKIGLLTQLGQDSKELKGEKYWWEDKSLSVTSSHDETEEVGLKSKVKLDPLIDMVKNTGSTYELASSSKVRKHKSKHKRKHPYKEKSKHKKHKKSKKETSVDMEALRKERLDREARERVRAERLLAGKDPDKDDQPTQSKSFQKYNSQFNPLFAQQNYNKK